MSSAKGLKQSRLSSKGIESFRNLRCEIVYIANYIVQTQQSQHYNGDTSFKNVLQPMQMNCTAWPVAWLGIRQPEGTEKRFISMILLLFEELKGWVSETSQTCPPRKRMGTKQSKPGNFFIISNKSFISQNLKVS